MSTTPPSTGLSPAEIDRFLDTHFPQSRAFPFAIEGITETSLTIRVSHSDDHLRPGGTIMGPTLMAAADTVTYLLILNQLGPIAQAVTTHLGMDFLRRPPPGDLLATAHVLRAGRALFVARVDLFTDADPRLVAQASVTYALPRAE